MMEIFTTNWVDLVVLAATLVIAGVLIYLYNKGNVKSGDLIGIAAMIDKISDALKNADQSDSVVSLFANYAARAVRAVEQFVKNGELEKDNKLRKNEAKTIVKQLAISDGIDIRRVYENEKIIDNLIEAAVNEMQSAEVEIEFDSEKVIELPPKVE